jgi:uncharacterized protein (TIGR02569 family)
VKPVDDPVEAQWTAELLSSLPEQGFRISRPVIARHGTYVVDGWTAWELVAGYHDTVNRWPDIIQTGQALNEALASAPRPAFVEARNGVWSIGDRVAWGEKPFQVHDPVLRSLATELRGRVTPNHEPSQLIHGDLSGNVLFSEGAAPAVIDFTPYWRPATFALAVVAVDAVCWYGAKPSVFDALPDVADRVSTLARAGIYRLVTADRAALAKTGTDRENCLAENRTSFTGLVVQLGEWCG